MYINISSWKCQLDFLGELIPSIIPLHICFCCIDIIFLFFISSVSLEVLYANLFIYVNIPTEILYTLLIFPTFFFGIEPLYMIEIHLS